MLKLFKLSPLTYLLLGSIALNVVLGTATYRLHSAKAVSDAALSNCQQTNKILADEIQKQVDACLVQDQVVSDYQSDKDVIRDKEETLLDAIDDIRPEKVRNKDILIEQWEKVVREDRKQEKEASETSGTYTNLDDLLPPDFSGLLESAHSEATN